jgi:hypothetical protein
MLPQPNGRGAEGLVEAHLWSMPANGKTMVLVSSAGAPYPLKAGWYHARLRPISVIQIINWRAEISHSLGNDSREPIRS